MYPKSVPVSFSACSQFVRLAGSNPFSYHLLCMACTILLLTPHVASATGFIDRVNAVANNEGREVGMTGEEVWQIADLTPTTPNQRSVSWTLGGVGIPLTINNNNVMSVAPPANAMTAIQNALNTIQNNTSTIVFTPGALGPMFNPTPTGPPGAAAVGNTLDIFFANFTNAGQPNNLGGAFLGNATGTVTPAGGPGMPAVFTANSVDLILDSTLTVFNPAASPTGYNPVVNPLVNPYATYTGMANTGRGDVESVVLHEVMHALGLQHPDRTIQNFNTNTRFSRNYQTSLGGGGGVVAGNPSFLINEDNFRTTGLVRMVEGTPSPMPPGEPFTVNPNGASSAVMDSTAGTGEIGRTITPDDLGGLAFTYQDVPAQMTANTLQTATAAMYANVIIESDFSNVAGNINNWNDVPTQATRNDQFTTAQVVGAVPNTGTMQILGSIAGRTNGPQAGQFVGTTGMTNSGDVDFYQFSAMGGSILLFDLDNGNLVGNSLNAGIEIFTAGQGFQSGAITDNVLSATTRAGSLTNLDPALVWQAGGTGLQNFFLKVSSIGTGNQLEGDYLVNISRIPEPATLLLVLCCVIDWSISRRRTSLKRPGARL